MQAGTAGTGERWRLTLVATPRADASDLLAGPFPTGDGLLSCKKRELLLYLCQIHVAGSRYQHR
jgi:hypothetical protein